MRYSKTHPYRPIHDFALEVQYLNRPPSDDLAAKIYVYTTVYSEVYLIYRYLSPEHRELLDRIDSESDTVIPGETYTGGDGSPWVTDPNFSLPLESTLIAKYWDFPNLMVRMSPSSASVSLDRLHELHQRLRVNAIFWKEHNAKLNSTRPAPEAGADEP